MIAFGVILDVCQRYKVVEEDRSNKGLNLKRGVIDWDGDDFDFLRPKDVTGQWILDQINVQYELISRIIGDNPSWKVYYVKRLGCSRDLGCQDVNFL